MRNLAVAVLLFCQLSLYSQQTSSNGTPSASSNATKDSLNDGSKTPESFNTYVISVTDGNWFESEREGAHVSVRLYGIQCPDRGTSVGEAAAQDLGRLVFGKTVHVKRVGFSVYGGILGMVTVDDVVNGKTKNTKVNESMISRGWAVANGFLDLPEINGSFQALESEAKQKGVGLWYRPGATVQAQ